MYRFRAQFLPVVLLLGMLGVLQAHPNHGAARHWELPSPDPDRIILTFAGDPATSRAVTWRTAVSVKEAFAELALARPDARFDLGAKRIAATTEQLVLTDGSAQVVHHHSAVFEGLKADTLYAYRVGDGKARWSEWIQFRTAKSEAAPFSFLYFGDAQNSVLSHWSRVVRAAYAKAPHAAFTVHAGDLINTANRDRDWAEWFKAGGWIHGTVTSLPVAGNHEYASVEEQDGQKVKRLSRHWRPQFTLPTPEGLPSSLAETVYSIDYQGVRIVALNSNEEVEAQAAWLDALLADNPNQWTILTFHHPIFSSGSGRENPGNRRALKPIIDKYKVDLLLQGHDHTYARGHTPVRLSEAESTTISSLYVNSVSGPKMYGFQQDGWNIYKPDGVVLDRKAENTPFFQVIDVDGDVLTYRAFMADGELYDATRLKKNPDGSKEILGWDAALGEERLFKNTAPHNMNGL